MTELFAGQRSRSSRPGPCDSKWWAEVTSRTATWPSDGSSALAPDPNPDDPNPDSAHATQAPDTPHGAHRSTTPAPVPDPTEYAADGSDTDPFPGPRMGRVVGGLAADSAPPTDDSGWASTSDSTRPTDGRVSGRDGDASHDPAAPAGNPKTGLDSGPAADSAQPTGNRAGGRVGGGPGGAAFDSAGTMGSPAGGGSAGRVSWPLVASIGEMASASALAVADLPGSVRVCLAEAEDLLHARDRLTSAIAARVEQVHAAGEARGHGHASTKTWLRTAGMTAAGAGRLVALAMELSRLPTVRARFAAGTLAEGHVATICAATARLTDEQAAIAEPILLGLADRATTAEIAKAGRYLHDVLNPDAAAQDADADYRQRFLLLRETASGGVEGEFRLPREAAARLRTLLDAYAKPRAECDDRPLRVRNADAFIALLEQQISTELLILVNAESLPDDPALSHSTHEHTAADTPTPDRTGHPGTAGHGTTRDSTRPVRTMPDWTTPPSTAHESAAGDSSARDSTTQDSSEPCSIGLDKTGQQDTAPDPDTTDTGRTDSGRAESGRAESGRAESGEPPDAAAETTTLEDAAADTSTDTGTDREATRRDAGADACGRCGHRPDRTLPGLLLATGQLLPVSDVHRLARTSTLVRIVMNADRQVLDMGRKVRLATPAQRRAVYARYTTCWTDGCPLPAHLCQIDHVDNWSDGGETNLDKLGPACQFHNRDRYRHPHRYQLRRVGEDRWAFTYLGSYHRHRPPTSTAHSSTANHTG